VFGSFGRLQYQAGWPGVGAVFRPASSGVSSPSISSAIFLCSGY